MARRVSTEDRLRARELFGESKTLSEIVDALEGRVSASWVSRISREENWIRGLLPPESVSAERPQIYETANASPEEMSANTDKLQEANRRRWLDKKAELAGKAGDAAERILAQVFAAHVVKDVKTVGLGGGVQDLRMVEIQLTEPTPADKKALATVFGILVDKASLLSGDATERVETSSLTKDQVADRLKHFRDELGKRREQKAIDPPKEAAG